MDAKDIALLGGLVDEADEDYDDDDDEGEDEGLYLMGARARGSRRRGLVSRGRRRSGGSRLAKRRIAKRREIEEAVIAPAPGLPARGPKYLPLPFPNLQFVNAGALTIQVQVSPQRPFKGVRLVIVEARSAATVVGLLTVSTFTMGVQPQQVAINPIGAGIFAPGSFEVSLAMDEIEPGVNATIAFTLSITPPVGETLDVNATILGLTIA